jgi:hypothetical protein
MAGLTVGTSGGNKDATEIHVGTAAGNKQVTEGWIGAAAGNQQFYDSGAEPPPGPLDAGIFSAGWQLAQVVPSIIWDLEASAIASGGSGSYTYSWSASGGGSITSGTGGATITMQSTATDQPSTHLQCVVGDGSTTVTPAADV